MLAFNVGIVSMSLLMVWLYLNVPHSLIPISLTHFVFNAAFQLAGGGGLGLAPDLPLLGWGVAGLAVAAAIVWIDARGGRSFDGGWDRAGGQRRRSLRGV